MLIQLGWMDGWIIMALYQIKKFSDQSPSDFITVIYYGPLMLTCLIGRKNTSVIEPGKTNSESDRVLLIL